MRRNSTFRIALVGGLIAVALIATLSPLAAAAIRETIVDQEARRVTNQVELLLSSSLTPDELRYGLTQCTRRKLDAIFASAHTVGAVHVRLWNRNGVLLYTTNGGTVGAGVPVSDALRAAVGPAPADAPGASRDRRPFTAGTMYLSFEGYLRYLAFREHQVWLASAVTEASPQAVIDDAAPDGVARLYLPIQLNGSSVRAGAFEVSYDFRPLERRVANLQRGVWTGIPGGVLALYGSLLLVLQQAPPVPRRRREDLHAVNVGFFRTLARVVDARDAGTGDHSGRVASYATAIGRRLALPREALAELNMAAGLHDIGKISVPDAVLKKPGPLTPDEWGLMRRHAIVGSRILHASPFSDAVKEGVRHAHEWWNGRGYPDRLKGEQIPVFARILAIADAFEAMTSTRPYRRALSSEEALAELVRMRGVQFDPSIVDLFTQWVHDGPSPDR